MRLKGIIKKIRWMIEHQEDLENIINKQNELKTSQQDKNFSIGGVPDFQRDYVSKLLSDDQKK